MSDILNYERDGAVAVITLNRPDSMNAFDAALRRRLLEALIRAGTDDDVRVIVLTGAGRSFSAGADLNEGMGDVPVGSVLQQEYRPVFETIAGIRQPVLAAIGGSAAGIGLSVALSCDLVLMADDAFLLSPFTTISLVPDGGLNWLLVRQLGYRQAFELCVEAERIPATRCVELGLVNRLVPAGELYSAALSWAQSLASRAPLAVAATKKALRFAADHDWSASFDLEAELQGDLLGTEDNREGIRAFFEKRKPDFRGR